MFAQQVARPTVHSKRSAPQGFHTPSHERKKIEIGEAQSLRARELFFEYRIFRRSYRESEKIAKGNKLAEARPQQKRGRLKETRKSADQNIGWEERVRAEITMTQQK